MKIIDSKLENLPLIIDTIRSNPVVLPTDTFYALSVPIISKELFDTVYKIKGIEMKSASPIGFFGLRDMEKYCIMDENAKNIVRKLMPGPLTLILDAKVQGHWVISGKIGARIPDNNITREVIRNIGPITLTGANLRGFRAPLTIGESIKQLGDRVKLYVDAGVLPGIPSTIYDYTNKRIIREGKISILDIRRAESGI